MKIWREIRFPVSLLLAVLGLVFTISGVVWIFLRESKLGLLSKLAEFFGNWNYYLIIIGVVILFAGVWYAYDYISKKKFLLEEIKTDRKSELVKTKAKLEKIAKTLPRKYEKMLIEKEEELGLR